MKRTFLVASFAAAALSVTPGHAAAVVPVERFVIPAHRVDAGLHGGRLAIFRDAQRRFPFASRVRLHRCHGRREVFCRVDVEDYTTQSLGSLTATVSQDYPAWANRHRGRWVVSVVTA